MSLQQQPDERPSPSPRGRDAVVEALIVAATGLFAERGVQGASVRDVAAAAGVNHALVFRHFGSKERLVRAVLDRMLDDLIESFRDTGVEPAALASFGEGIALRESLWKLLMRAVLDGEIDFLTERSFPEIEGVVEAVERARSAGLVNRSVDPRVLLLVTLSGGVGWILLDPILTSSLGVPGGTPARRRELARASYGELLGSLPAGAVSLTAAEEEFARLERPPLDPPPPAPAPSSDREGPPRGREEVSAALVDAAMQLFAERGVAAVSVREVAARAGVNHALVFRHFGSKDGLAEAVWERVGEVLGSFVVGGVRYSQVIDLTEALAESETIWRLVARSLLDGAFDSVGRRRYRFIEEMVWAIRSGQEAGLLESRTHPRLLVAMIIAVGLGWLIFHPVLRPLLGMPMGDGPEMRTELREAVVTLLGWKGDPAGA